MGTTTKMAIPYPASTDLVKDGATAMQSLSEQVDAKSGLVLISTTTIGSSVSSVTIPNVFTTNFDNYRIVWNFGDATNTNTTPTYFRLAASSTPDTSANYYRRTAMSGDASLVNSIESGVSYIYVGSLDTGESSWSGWSVDVFSPFKAKPTVLNILSFSYEGQLQGLMGGGLHTVSTSYDGFRWYLNTGTVSGGTISVYAYNK